jgi:hypothetical protein
MLWMYQRVFYGEVSEGVGSHVFDLKPREWAAVVPLVVMMFWMGVYSKSFLDPVGKTNAHLLDQTHVNVPFRVQVPSGVKPTLAGPGGPAQTRGSAPQISAVRRVEGGHGR